MDNFSKDGRKLRPRKNAGGSAVSRAEKVDIQAERFDSGERRSYGAGRSYGQGRSYGKNRGYGEGRGQGRCYGEGRSYGEGRQGAGRSYGENRGRSYGQGRGTGEGRSYGEGRAQGERRSYGEGRQGAGRSYGENRGRSYGQGRGTGAGRPYDDRKQGAAHSDRKREGRRPAAGGNRAAAGRGKKFQKPNPYMFNKNSDAGINRMISRRPIVEESNYSDADSVPTIIKDEIRLNKFIANSGICSRREADTLIAAGVVTVNGQVVTELGTKVNVHDDDIRFNGERLKGEEKVYIVMNKPVGYVTTASDPHAGKTVIDLVQNCPARVYPVGRLDKNTTGVLMLTNDGEIAERLTHPSYDKKKIYQVILDHELSQEDYDKILSGITLSDGDVNADSLEYIDESDKRKLGIEIHSGKNRIVRRIFESLGYSVKALDRVYFAGLTKQSLKKGEWRYLSENEVNILKMGAYV